MTGRWLSNDPIGISGGLNQYVFCGDNPVNFRDPIGLCEGDATNEDFNSPTYGTATYLGSRPLSDTVMGTPSGQNSITRGRELTEENGWEWARWLGIDDQGQYGATPWVSQESWLQSNPGMNQYINTFSGQNDWLPAGHIHTHPREMPPSPGDADPNRWVNERVISPNPNATDFYVITPDNVYQVVPGRGYYHLTP